MSFLTINKILILTFAAFNPILAFKCYFGAQLAEYFLMGCSGFSTDGESGSWGKDAAPGLKMSPTMPKMDSWSLFFYILKFSI